MKEIRIARLKIDVEVRYDSWNVYFKRNQTEKIQ